jgi:16S rRNA (adenine1518-N6/adenine1519-N6)-dimethyltransferase
MKTYKAKKSLGQNFLKSVLALNKIVEAGEISKKDIILEIGPGKGILTEKLLEKAGCVIAVEKDRNLFQLLQEKFSEQIEKGKLILLEEDILKIDPLLISPLAGGEKTPMTRGVGGVEYKIIANIPYNITGAILKKFLTEKNQPERMILMVQNEVAGRIMARDGKESILSISVKAYGDPKMVLKVPARYFSPVPDVDSAIIAIKNISRRIFVENKIDENQFWEIVRAGFSHKRKKLSSNLKNIDPFLICPLAGGEKTPMTRGVGGVIALGNKRAEEFSLENWIELAKTVDINKKE